MLRFATFTFSAVALCACGLQQDITDARADIDGNEQALNDLAADVGSLAEQVGPDGDGSTSLEGAISELKRLIGDGTDIEDNVIDYINERDQALAADIAALQAANSELETRNRALEARLADVESGKADRSELGEVTTRVEAAEAALSALAEADLVKRMKNAEDSITANATDVSANTAAIVAARSDLATLRDAQDDLADALADLESNLTSSMSVWGLNRGGKPLASRAFSGKLSSTSPSSVTLLESCDLAYIELETEIDSAHRASDGVAIWVGTTATTPAPYHVLHGDVNYGGSIIPVQATHKLWIGTAGAKTLTLKPTTTNNISVTLSHIGCINLP